MDAISVFSILKRKTAGGGQPISRNSACRYREAEKRHAAEEEAKAKAADISACAVRVRAHSRARRAIVKRMP